MADKPLGDNPGGRGLGLAGDPAGRAGVGGRGLVGMKDTKPAVQWCAVKQLTSGAVVRYRREKMKTRVGDRFREYDDSQYSDDDFTHCEDCGIEILKTDAYRCSNCGEYACPDCVTDKWNSDQLTCDECAEGRGK